MNRRPHMRCLLVFTLLACRGKAKEAAPPPPTVEVRDTAGDTLTAELRPIKPCRGTIGPMELIVGGPPLIAQIGDVRWTGEHGDNGTTLSRDGEAIARVQPVGDPTSAAVFDLHGIAVIRVAVQGMTAQVTDASATAVRTLTKKDKAIVVDQPALTIRGTEDLVLAALLSAPEISPELRVLSACERVLVKR